MSQQAMLWGNLLGHHYSSLQKHMVSKPGDSTGYRNYSMYDIDCKFADMRGAHLAILSHPTLLQAVILAVSAVSTTNWNCYAAICGHQRESQLHSYNKSIVVPRFLRRLHSKNDPQ